MEQTTAGRSETRIAHRLSELQRHPGIMDMSGWVRRGMGERFARIQQVEHRVQMLLGALSAKGVLPLEFKPVYSVSDLLVQHLEELEAEAERKGVVQELLAAHFAKVYKVQPSYLPVLGRAA